MKRFLGVTKDKEGIIEGEELNHLKNVLRLKEGDECILINGDGYEYHSQILKLEKNKAILMIKTQKKCKNNAKNSISLFLSAIKRENLELVVQKATELGIKNLYIFESQFSNMKLKDEKISRYEKIMLSSLKQCERADKMKIEIVTFEKMLTLFSSCKTRLFANEREGEEFDFASIKGKKDIGILIGCEGGFSDEEKSKILSTCRPENISLGNRILRAETAAILLCGIAMLFSGN